MAGRRDKGLGSVTQLPNGKYKITFTIGYDLNNKQIRKSFTGKTKRECLDRMKAYSGQDKVKNLVFDACFENFLEYKKISLSSAGYKSIEGSYNRLKQFITYPIDKINTDILINAINGLSGKYSPQTVKTTCVHLKDFFNYSLDRGYISLIPKFPKTPQTTDRTVIISLPDEKGVLEILEKAYEFSQSTPKRKLIYYIFLLALATGMRKGEILALHWNKIDFEKHTIKIDRSVTKIKGEGDIEVKPKTTSSLRTISVDKSVLDVIKEIPNVNTKVFALTSGKLAIPSTRVSQLAQEILAQSGFPELTFHDLRHIHATFLLKNKIDLKTISRRLGHANPAMTLRKYAHFMPEVDKEASQILGSILVLKKCL